MTTDAEQKLPQSLAEIVAAPAIRDQFGNQILADWRITFPPIKFDLGNLTSPVNALAIEQQPPVDTSSDNAWPGAFNFTTNLIGTIDYTNNSKSLLRNVILGASGGDANGLTEAVNIVMNQRNLLAVVILALVMSFIIVPIASCVTHFLIKRKYKQQFRYNAYSSDSLASMMNANNNNNKAPWPSPAYSHGFVALAVVALLACVGAIFGLVASFQAEQRLTHSMTKTAPMIADKAMADVRRLADRFSKEFELVGDTVGTDVGRKMAFAENITDSLGKVLADQNKAFDLLHKSKGFLLFFILLSWEKSTVEPLGQAFRDALNATQDYNQVSRNLIEFQEDDEAMAGIATICQRSFNATWAANCPQSALPVNGDNSSLCSSCLMPTLPSKIDPSKLRIYLEGVDVEQTLHVLANRSFTLAKTKMGQIVTKEQLIRQFNALQANFTKDMEAWVDHYKAWFESRLEPILRNDMMTCPDEIARKSTTTTTTTTTTTPPKNATVSVSPDDALTAPSNGEADEDDGSSQNSITAMIKKWFHQRHYVMVALMALAVVQLSLTVVGCLCLLVLYCRFPSRNFRALQATKLEIIGRTCILAGSILFVAITGPALCLSAAGHFFASAMADRSVCSVIRSGNHLLLDEMLNQNGSNILRSLLPECIAKLVDSVDEDLLNNRMTIGKLLAAAQQDLTINQYLVLNDTKFVNDVRHLTYLTLSSQFVVLNDKVADHLTNLSDILSKGALVAQLLDGWSLDDAKALESTLRNCTTCVNTAINSNSAAARSRNSDHSAQMGMVSIYRSYLDQYSGQLSESYQTISEAKDMVAIALEQQQQLTETFRFVEQFFMTVLLLLKRQMGSMINMMIDNVFEAFTADIGHLRGVYDLYDKVANQFVCQQLAGDFSAFWLFVGIYLVFSTISALLCIATYSALTSLSSRTRTLEQVLRAAGRRQSIAKMNSKEIKAASSLEPPSSGYLKAMSERTVAAYRNAGFVFDTPSIGGTPNDSAESYIMQEIVNDDAGTDSSESIAKSSPLSPRLVLQTENAVLHHRLPVLTPAAVDQQQQQVFFSTSTPTPPRSPRSNSATPPRTPKRGSNDNHVIAIKVNQSPGDVDDAVETMMKFTRKKEH